MELIVLFSITAAVGHPAVFAQSTDECQDRDASCSSWALMGQCQSNPDYMMPHCPVSCDNCPASDEKCYDKDDQCFAWSRRGHCEANAAYMAETCSRSCNSCSSMPSDQISVVSSKRIVNDMRCGSFDHSMGLTVRGGFSPSPVGPSRASGGLGRVKRADPTVAGGSPGARSDTSGGGSGSISSGSSSFGGGSSSSFGGGSSFSFGGGSSSSFGGGSSFDSGGSSSFGGSRRGGSRRRGSGSGSSLGALFGFGRPAPSFYNRPYEPYPRPVYQPRPTYQPPYQSPYRRQYGSVAPPYRPAAPVYRPSSQAYRPAAPAYRPTATVYRPAAPAYRQSTTNYRPASPAYRPATPAYRPPTTNYRPASPSYRPSAPNQRPTTGSVQSSIPAANLPSDVIRRNPTSSESNNLVPFDDIFCGISLISDQYLLTAAHCVTRESKPPRIVTLGEYDYSRNNDGVVPVNYEVESVIVHPEYKRNSLIRYHDLALLKTRRKVQFTRVIWPYCLPSPDTNVAFQQLTVSGWGKVNASHTSPEFQQAQIPAVPNSDCESSFNEEGQGESLKFRYPQGLTKNLICAGQLGRDACQGDSGGSLTYQDETGRQVLVGVVSVGLPCGDLPKLPGIYVNVAEYVDWINSVVYG